MNRAILITGSTGYVGGYLAKSLSDYFKVFVLNRRLDHFITKENQIVIDSSNGVKIDRSMNIDAVIHCMGLAHKKLWVKSRSLNDINVNLAVEIARESIKAGVNKFIFISTANVYGTSSESKIEILYNTKCEPVDEYSQSKVNAEIELKKLFQSTKSQLIIIRPPLIYGERNYKGNLRLIELFIRLRVPLPIGLLTAKRSYLSLENLSSFIRICLNENFNCTNPFILRDNKNLSLKEISEMISESISIRVRILSVNQDFVKIISNVVFGKRITIKFFQECILNQEETKRVTGWNPVN